MKCGQAKQADSPLSRDTLRPGAIAERRKSRSDGYNKMPTNDEPADPNSWRRCVDSAANATRSKFNAEDGNSRIARAPLGLRSDSPGSQCRRLSIRKGPAG